MERQVRRMEQRGPQSMSVDYDKIQRLITLVEENQLTELTVEEDGLNITIKAEPGSGQIQAPAVQLGPVDPRVETSTESLPQTGEPSEVGDTECVFEIRSPMIGIFYRAPSPDSPQYIEVGDEIEVDQTIGLIEAMKVFSEVPSEVAGRVVAIPAENGKLVQQGDVLAVVDTSVAGVQG